MYVPFLEFYCREKGSIFFALTEIGEILRNWGIYHVHACSTSNKAQLLLNGDYLLTNESAIKTCACSLLHYSRDGGGKVLLLQI